MKNKIRMISFMAIAAVLLSGCGGTASNPSETAEQTGTESAGHLSAVSVGKGIYLDGPVEGVHYVCGALSGWTGPQGDFRYEIGKECHLSVGALQLRKIDKDLLRDDHVTILETNPKIARLLLSLDVDPAPGHIRLDPLIAQEMNAPEYNTTIGTIDLRTTLNRIRASLEAKGIIHEPVRIVHEDAALQHLQQTHQDHCGDADYRLAENGAFLGPCRADTHSTGSPEDTIPPVLELKGGEEITLYAGSPFQDPGASATDDRDGTVTVQIQGHVDTQKAGTYTLTYMAVDAAGNKAIGYRTVNVILPPDITSPVIELKGASVISIDLNQSFVDPGATATDDRDGNLTDQIVREGHVDVTREQSYLLTYRVQDRAGNHAETKRTVIVTTAPDTRAPEIRLKGDNPLIIKKYETFSDPGVNAFDDRDGDISRQVRRSGSVDTDRVGDYNLTYTVRDRAGNAASAVRVVRVEKTPDTTPPVISLKGTNPLVIEQGRDYQEPGATATDDRDGDVNVQIAGTVDTDAPGDYPITYTAEDTAGNRASVVRTVQVVLPPDTTPPVITLKGSETIEVQQGDTFQDPGAAAVDDRDGNVPVQVSGTVDTDTLGTYTLTYTAIDSVNNRAKKERTVRVVSSSNEPDYSYIPSGNDLTDAMAVKFLNMATFGATPAQVAELKNMGVEAWVDQYLGMAYNDRTDSLLRKVIQRCIAIDYKSFDSQSHTVDEWLNDGIIYRNQLRYFNQNKINGIHEIDHHFSLLFDQQIRGRNQLRQRVAYALSQLIIASESNDNFFHERGEALSYYYDLLMKHAFGNYGDLLYDVSMSPTMATFLTYASNPKAFVDPDTGSTILPDENYGREIMQLFTIGLYELNMDGTEKRRDGKRIPTYVQEDVNNMSRVFTGLNYNNTKWGGTTYTADMTHPLTCNPQYHDSDPKTVLGVTLQGSDDCAQDVRAAVDMLMQHPNVAPFVAKKLILRLTKSNPTTAYIQRVAEVFAATHGDLGQTVKAILLDPEIWENIKEDRGTKIKEPYLAFTQMVRALDYKPVPSFSWTVPSNKPSTQKIDHPGFVLDAYTRFPLYAYFGQFPTHSPSVFNFYDDEFVPDDSEFKIRGFVAPELEIITPKYAVAYNNFVSLLLYEASVPRVLERYGSTATPENNPKAYHASRTYMYQEYTEAMPIADANRFYDGDLSASEKTAARERMATALVDLYSQKLLGKKLDTDQRQAIIDYYKNLNRWSTQGNKSDAYRRREFVQFFVRPIILDILHTDTYMVN